MKPKKLKPHEVAAARQHEKEIRVEIDERDVLENLNREGMCHVMNEFGVTFSPREFAAWKPTKRTLGAVVGVYSNVEIIAHNGMLGLFRQSDGVLVYAHVSWFDGKVENLFSNKKVAGETTGAKHPRTKNTTKSLRRQILDSL